MENIRKENAPSSESESDSSEDEKKRWCGVRRIVWCLQTPCLKSWWELPRHKGRTFSYLEDQKALLEDLPHNWRPQDSIYYDAMMNPLGHPPPNCVPKFRLPNGVVIDKGFPASLTLRIFLFLFLTS